MGRLKKLLTCVFSIVLMISLSANIFAAEINQDEKRILSSFSKEPFKSKLDKKYINQFENYFSLNYVDLEAEKASGFLKHFSRALVEYDNSKKDGKIFGQSTKSFKEFQLAASNIGLYLEYDSDTNDFYAVEKDGYVVIDSQKIIKDTGEDSNNEKEAKNEKSRSVPIELLFVFVLLLCFVGFLFNIKRFIIKIRKHSEKNYDDEEDEMEVANRKTRRARLQTFSYKNFKQVIKYCYVPILMCVVILLSLFLVFRSYSVLYKSLKEGFIQALTVNSYSEKVKGYDKAPDVKAKTIKGTKINWPKSTEPYGEIKCKDIKLKAPLFMGDSDYVLSGRIQDKVENDIEDEFESKVKEKFDGGAGTYLGSSIPGDGKTILVGAHDTTYFKPLKDVKKGMVMNVNTSYARYKYKVKKIKIFDENKTDAAYDLQSDKETLILYTCYPFGKLNGDKDKRMFVYLEKTYGPSIDKEVTK